MSVNRLLLRKTLAAAMFSLAIAPASFAGSIMIAGTDADDHGFVSGGANQSGWLFMQKAFENVAAGVSSSNRTVVCFGCSSTAQAAFASAFDLSTLAGGGWNRVTLNGATAITNFFNGTGAVNINNAGIIYMPTVDGNVAGGLTNAELAVVNANAAALDAFLAAGGGLFSQEQNNSSIGYGWLTTLLPGVTTQGDNGGPGFDSGSLSLTAAGSAAFPGLTNSILSSATPWHGYFLPGSAGFGGLQTLVTGPVFSVPGGGAVPQAVVLGGVGGSITTPPPTGAVPEPTSMLMLGTGVVALVLRRRFTK